jgi:hypothetical protein
MDQLESKKKTNVKENTILGQHVIWWTKLQFANINEM